MKIKQNENEVKKDIMGFLKLYPHKIFIWRNNTQGTYIKSKGSYMFHGLKGVPDLIGMTNVGRFIGIETKATGKKQSEDQIKFETECKKMGGIYILADSFDIFLEEIKKESLI